MDCARPVQLQLGAWFRRSAAAHLWLRSTAWLSSLKPLPSPSTLAAVRRRASISPSALGSAMAAASGTSRTEQ